MFNLKLGLNFNIFKNCLNPEYSKRYNDKKLIVLTKERNIYHLKVLESLFYKNL